MTSDDILTTNEATSTTASGGVAPGSATSGSATSSNATPSNATPSINSAQNLASTQVPDRQFKELAQRIAGLRDACGYSPEEFADALGVDRATYRAYEETGFDVPASLLMHIAHVCKVDMAVILTGGTTHLDTYQIVRAGTGQVVDRFPGYHFQDLAYNYTGKTMQPLLVTLDPSDEPAELVTHAGQEFNYVTQGRVVLVFADREIELDVGDSVYFNPQIPHGQRCGSDGPATFVTMITE